ncbi:MAG TPA: antitoxin MazE family protein [Tepidiformaceae bacterium]|nr:antitoxin MazE family protein [Tepidiformaceae bacterium]
MSAKSSTERVRAYRERQRKRGLRLIQMWVPDVGSPEFAAEAHRQSLLAAEGDRTTDDQDFIESVLDEDGW